MAADDDGDEKEYRVGRGKPPLHTRFQKGRSGNPAGPGKKDLAALLLAALNEETTVNTDGHRRRITKREAIVGQLVDRSAGADISAIKLLIAMLKDIEKKVAPPPDPGAETRPLGRSDAAIVASLTTRLRRMIQAETAETAGADAANRADPAPPPPLGDEG
jgi:hypothetical protein